MVGARCTGFDPSYKSFYQSTAEVLADEIYLLASLPSLLHPYHSCTTDTGNQWQLVTMVRDVDPVFRTESTSRFWWRVKDLNLRRQSRGIYRPLPLAARATRQGRTSTAAIMDNAKGKDTLAL